jgi:uncharacterized protein (DUF2062 family)
MFHRRLRIVYQLHSLRLQDFLYRRVLHADDPPHRLALGAAIGMFVMVTPTPGLQIAGVLFLAWLLRANKVVGLPLVWISNPATAVPIFYPCYVIGRWILHRPGKPPTWWKELATPPAAWDEATAFYWAKFLEIAMPLWVGCLVVGLFLGWITYHAVYRAVAAYRLKRWGQLTPPAATPQRERR